MRTLLSIAAVLIFAGAIVATATASLRTYTVGTKYVTGVGTVGSFNGTVKTPYKIILYCEGASPAVGRRGAFEGLRENSTRTGSGLGPYTWNLKKKGWKGRDSRQFTATIKSGSNRPPSPSRPRFDS